MSDETLVGKNKGKLKIINTHMGVFDFQIRCLVGNYEAGLKHASNLFEDNVEEVASESNGGYMTRGQTFYRVGYVPIVWIPRRPQTPREYATLAHECIHAINHMFHWAAVPLGGDTEEVFAHSVSHLMTSILEALPTKKKTRSKKVSE